MRQHKFLFVFFGVLFILNSCSKQNETWDGEISNIIFTKCSPCHYNYFNGHFTLLSYEDVKNKAGMIKYVIEHNKMPPWPAEVGYGHFVNELKLTKNEKESLLSWIDKGCEKGNQNVSPPTFDNSFFGKPDFSIKVKPILIEGNGKDHFYIMKIPFELPYDTIAQCIEYVPSRYKLVHHVNGDLIRYDDNKPHDIFKGESLVTTSFGLDMLNVYSTMNIPYEDGSYPVLQKSTINFLPGVFPTFYPEELGGIALNRKNVFLFNDIHYGATDHDVLDSALINIYFKKSKIKRKVEEFQLGTLGLSPIEPALNIPPNKVSSYSTHFKIDRDISILTVNPHMHLLGKSFKAFAVAPDGDTIKLIKISHWDFNWQYFYTYTHPVKVPAGSTIWALGVYDNTTNNFFNPNSPPIMVSDNSKSMSSTDEMFQFIVNYVFYEKGDEYIDMNKHEFHY